MFVRFVYFGLFPCLRLYVRLLLLVCFLFLFCCYFFSLSGFVVCLLVCLLFVWLCLSCACYLLCARSCCVWCCCCLFMSVFLGVVVLCFFLSVA